MKTRRALRNEGLLLPSFNMRTSAGPMRELEDAARGATTGAIREVAVFGGFPYADTVHTGASVLVVSDASLDPQGIEAERVAQAMSDRMRALAPAFDVRLPSASQAIAKALASTRPGLIAVTDPADNPLSGGGGDTPGMLRALLEARVAVPTLFASFADRDRGRRRASRGRGERNRRDARRTLRPPLWQRRPAARDGGAFNRRHVPQCGTV